MRSQIIADNHRHKSGIQKKSHITPYRVGYDPLLLFVRMIKLQPQAFVELELLCYPIPKTPHYGVYAGRG